MITEAEFIDRIDCCFTKKDKAKAKKLIRLAGCICPNAAFMTAYEIVSLSNQSQSYKNELLQALCKSFYHPMKAPILRLLMGRKKRVSRSYVYGLAQKLKAYPNQYCALSLVTDQACDPQFVAIENFWKENTSLRRMAAISR